MMEAIVIHFVEDDIHFVEDDIMTSPTPHEILDSLYTLSKLWQMWPKFTSFQYFED